MSILLYQILESSIQRKIRNKSHIEIISLKYQLKINFNYLMDHILR